MSGHSKWSTIKHKKSAADAKRGKVFTKLIKEITTSARIGGGDPSGNPRLRKAIDTARAALQADVRIERRLEDDVAVDLSAAPVFDEQGNVDSVLVVLRDRTLRSAIEEDATERDRLDWSARIALGIAHEVKNPLGGIRGAGELIARRAQTEKTRTTAELIVREVDRIARLVDDFMVLARDEELHFEETNIHQVLDEALDVLAHDAMSEPSTVKRASYWFLRWWMCPQCPTEPATFQVPSAANPVAPGSGSLSELSTSTSFTFARAPPWFSSSSERRVSRYTSVSSSPETLWSRVS